MTAARTFGFFRGRRWRVLRDGQSFARARAPRACTNASHPRPVSEVTERNGTGRRGGSPRRRLPAETSESATRPSASSCRLTRPIRRRAGSGDRSRPRRPRSAGVPRARGDRSPWPGRSPARDIPACSLRRTEGHGFTHLDHFHVVGRDDPARQFARREHPGAGRRLGADRIERHLVGLRGIAKGRQHGGLASLPLRPLGLREPVGEEQPDRPAAALGLAQEESPRVVERTRSRPPATPCHRGDKSCPTRAHRNPDASSSRS